MAHSEDPASGNGGQRRQLRGLSAAQLSQLSRLSPRQIRTLSLLTDRAQAAGNLGLAFDTGATRTSGYDRDLNFELGRKSKLSAADYRAMYERGGIAERIAEAYPKATWAGGASVVEAEDPGKVTDFEVAVGDLFERLTAWSRFERADILAGLGRYSVLLIGGAPDSLDDELADNLSGPEGVLYLSTFGEDRAPIDSTKLEATTSERYGLPVVYNLKLSRAGQKAAHYSRIVHVAEGCLDDEVYGKPRLRAIWDYLHDLIKVAGGGSEAAWRHMDRGMQFDLDPEIELDETEEGKYDDEVKEYRMGLKRDLRTSGVKVNDLGAAAVGFGPNVKCLLELISGTVGIPQRLLLGSERGEQASTQDRGNWWDRITERRATFAAPIVRDLLDRLIEHGALPRPESYEIVWPQIEELDEGQKAEVADRLAAANQKSVLAGAGLLVTADEIRDSVLGRGPMDEMEGALPAALRANWRERLRVSKLVLNRSRIAVRSSLRAAEDFEDVEDAPDSPEWKSVHRAADAHRKAVARAFAGMWADAAGEIDLAALEPLLTSRATETAVSIVSAALDEAQRELSETLPDRLLGVLIDGGLAALRSARSRGSLFRSSEFRGTTFSMEFDAANPRAIEWAVLRAAALITEVSPETIAAVRALIAAGFEAGTPPRVLARQVRDIVGIRSDQAQRLVGLAERMRAAEPGDVVMAGKTRIRIPKTGVTENLIEKRVSEYARRLRSQRAILIARTETMRAANAGQKELWLQARDTGLLESDQKRVWIVTPDDALRDEHAAMAGQVRGLEEPFQTEAGRALEPGQDPNCRCSHGLALEEDLETAEEAA